MKKYIVNLQYPLTTYYAIDVEVEAEDAHAAAQKALEMEYDGSIDWSLSYSVGEGEPGATDVWSVDEILRINEYEFTEDGERY